MYKNVGVGVSTQHQEKKDAFAPIFSEHAGHNINLRVIQKFTRILTEYELGATRLKFNVVILNESYRTYSTQCDNIK